MNDRVSISFKKKKFRIAEILGHMSPKYICIIFNFKKLHFDGFLTWYKYECNLDGDCNGWLTFGCDSWWLGSTMTPLLKGI
jgi:hypothetical protein